MAAKKRQQVATRPVDLSHMTRPKLDPLVQQTLESVGMRTRKALSDAQYKRDMAIPQNQEAMKLAVLSNAELISKPLPFYEIKSAKDPWAAFREAGRKPVTSTRLTKRGRTEEEFSVSAPIQQRSTEVETPISLALLNDPNDLEFTNPPWLASQESLQSDDEMAE